MGTKREERIENFVGGKRSTTSKKKYKNHSSMSFFQISILQHIFYFARHIKSFDFCHDDHFIRLVAQFHSHTMFLVTCVGMEYRYSFITSPNSVFVTQHDQICKVLGTMWHGNSNRLHKFHIQVICFTQTIDLM